MNVYLFLATVNGKTQVYPVTSPSYDQAENKIKKDPTVTGYTLESINVGRDHIYMPNNPREYDLNSR